MSQNYADAVNRAASNLKEWGDLPFFTDGSFTSVQDELTAETAPIFPPAEKVFAALQRTPPSNVNTVILGQDPYPTVGHANGLAFSVSPEVSPLPRSLKNIYKELAEDLGEHPATGDLGDWADKGVLLLNNALTVREGEAGSHAKIGWVPLIEQIIRHIADRDGIVWILWGRHAQARRSLIDAGKGKNTLIIESAHPSPLSASRGFFGSRPFSRAEGHAGRALFT